MYASPVEEEVIEDGTIEGANQYKKIRQDREEDELMKGQLQVRWH